MEGNTPHGQCGSAGQAAQSLVHYAQTTTTSVQLSLQLLWLLH